MVEIYSKCNELFVPTSVPVISVPEEYWQHHGHEPDGHSGGSLRYREWLMRQTSGLQDAILGKEKADDFRRQTHGR